MAPAQDELFQLPPGFRRPRAQVIILTGPSGSGKTSLSSRVGVPSLALDDFYRGDDEDGLPMISDNIVDWDDPRSWNDEAAFAAVAQLCIEGQAEVPIYDIPSNRRTGTRTITLGRNRLFIAEGIFASELIPRLIEEGLMADAICIARSPLRNAWFRFLRDVAEARKPVPVLVHRGIRLARQEPKKIRQWKSQGCRPVPSLDAAEADLKLLHHRSRLTQPQESQSPAAKSDRG
ncbi:uridine kinase family protein [Actinomyces minihominis]|uniref:uridine kinase family protein n=1 Tax=Actinomyces minihominis TaxID=2002838 RepID=UPI001A919F33|nr:ATP-binding protein [Actinomyces minihominis]